MYPESRDQASEVVGVLCDPVCVQVFAQVLGSVSDPDAISVQITAPIKRVAGALSRLSHVGLMAPAHEGAPVLQAHLEVLRRARQVLTSPAWAIRFLDAEPRLSGMIEDGRIRYIPTNPTLRSSFASLIMDEVTADTSTLTETELCRRLDVFGFDVAQLRRLLIDESLMTRDPATAVYVRR